MSLPFYTIGHSTRSLPEFVSLLKQVDVEFVVDVRSIPRSRTNPQFNAETLPGALQAFEIHYRLIGALGGRRSHKRSDPPSRNLFWENSSFRNYADYAATPPFAMGLAELRILGHAERCAIMCAEAVWWRCHRRIISDYLLMNGEAVLHIMGLGKIEPATISPGAVQNPDGTILYPMREKN